MFRRLQIILKSLRLYLVIMFPYRRWHLRLRRASGIEITEFELQVGGRRLLPDVYRRPTTSTQRKPAVIIFVPLAQEGKRDRIITNFMEGLAQLGAVVLVPTWPDRVKGTITATDEADLAACLRWLRSQPDVDPNRIGVVAASYGAGPALLLASRLGIGHTIQFIATIGGYADLKNVAQFALTGSFGYGRISDQLRPDPYLQTMIRTTAQNWPRGAAMTRFLTSRSVADFEAGFTELPTRFRAWFTKLSPIHRISHVRVPLLILHSTNDTLVPYTESLRLYDAIRDRSNASLTLVNVFEHTVPVPATPASLIRIYLPNLVGVMRYIYRILAYQG